MADPVESLILDLLEWIGPESRPYAQVMDAWRTSCPRLTVWEDAIDAGLIRRSHRAGQPTCIELTPAGEALLASR